MDLSALVTEQRNENSMNLDRMSVRDILTTINSEDHKVAGAVKDVLPQVEVAVNQIVKAFQQGGRLFYVGAGTSGRLGVLDAAECVPTYRTPPDMIQAIIAGGPEAMTRAAEGIEDDEEQGAAELRQRGLSRSDVVVGIAASGRTPYPLGALKYARKVGAYTIALTCNRDSLMSRHADCSIEVVVGPEVVSGSTRMKAATSHKMILTMMSTAAMVKLGKTYENLMVDVQATNAKLVERAKRMVVSITGVPYSEAEEALAQAGYEVKTAIVMLEAGVPLEQAREALAESSGHVRVAIERAKSGL
ncbi:N-acetylmuramic acid-6-phosphate etherase [Gordoniibacillus kamchatkensis]|uniref:N-acetylmuramic acid 6-phosphate etherase n=1 Tax=Gordoniibacillus kamchatkensis TaxID=1590651 RepID=A0ABR5AA18_9BACL|nr:N-acetylmuramic acid 6-phosphate etherase [Paenibacillus sp. VKM B-2647]KIL37832.1 N-acetylmuramic acid-6-phosphate etherase [Paenibacillus sp. VKM B-2647]